MTKKLSHSVRIQDCRVDTFTVPGHGGSGKDTSNTGVRITHPPSGAVGQAVDSRSQLRNKQTALRRLAQTQEFLRWTRLEVGRRAGQVPVEDLVDAAMDPALIRLERRNADGIWEPWDGVQE